jgi:hypothetical protein
VFRVEGLGFRVKGLGFRGLRIEYQVRVNGLRFRV